MADYPCDHHGARYNGPSHRVYLNVYREEDKFQLKGSVCGQCLTELVSDWMSWALYKTPEGWTLPDPGSYELETRWMPAEEPASHRNGRYRS